MTRTPRTSRRRPMEGPTVTTGQTIARRPVMNLLPASRGAPPQGLRRAMRPRGARQGHTRRTQAAAAACPPSGPEACACTVIHRRAHPLWHASNGKFGHGTSRPSEGQHVRGPLWQGWNRSAPCCFSALCFVRARSSPSRAASPAPKVWGCPSPSPGHRRRVLCRIICYSAWRRARG